MDKNNNNVISNSLGVIHPLCRESSLVSPIGEIESPVGMETFLVQSRCVQVLGKHLRSNKVRAYDQLVHHVPDSLFWVCRHNSGESFLETFSPTRLCHFFLTCARIAPKCTESGFAIMLHFGQWFADYSSGMLSTAWLWYKCSAVSGIFIILSAHSLFLNPQIQDEVPKSKCLRVAQNHHS